MRRDRSSSSGARDRRASASWPLSGSMTQWKPWAVDVNPNKHGMFMPGTGHEIIAPERLPEIAPDWVIVLNPAYADEITADIRGMGLRPKVLLSYERLGSISSRGAVLLRDDARLEWPLDTDRRVVESKSSVSRRCVRGSSRDTTPRPRP